MYIDFTQLTWAILSFLFHNIYCQFSGVPLLSFVLSSKEEYLNTLAALNTLHDVNIIYGGYDKHSDSLIAYLCMIKMDNQN